MIREKYQFSGYGSIEGFGAIPSVATYAGRFMKKDYGITGNFAADPFASDMMLGVQKQKQLQKEMDASGGKMLSVAAGEVDSSVAVSAVCVSKGRFYEAERDKIRRFQRGEYDGEFLIGGNRNRSARGGDDAVDNMLKKLGEDGRQGSDENALQQRRASFVMYRAAGRSELFGGDGEPIYSAAYKEGLSEDQSRELLRRMEAMHRGQREEQRRWDEERRLREAEELRRRTKEEDDDELRRLKERLNKANTRLDEASHDVKNLDAFLDQLNEMKKKFGQGGAVGEDVFLGDEFMDSEGAIHNLLVHDHNRHLPPGAASRKQRLYAALHYGAVVDPEGGEEGTAHKGGKDAHTKCPCCGKSMNDVSDRHNPLRIHLERLQREVKRQKSIALLIGESPTLTPDEMFAITSCQKNMKQIREEAVQRHKERNTFKIPKNAQEAAESDFRRVKRQIRRTKARLLAEAKLADDCNVCAVGDDANTVTNNNKKAAVHQSSDDDDDLASSSDDDINVIQRENEVDEGIIEMCEKTMFHVTNTGTLKTLELTDDARGTYERYQEVHTSAVPDRHHDTTQHRDESGSGATGGMLTIHQQRHLGPLLNVAAQKSGGGGAGDELRGGAPASMSAIRASTGGTILVAPTTHNTNNNPTIDDTHHNKKKGALVASHQPVGTITRARDLLKSLDRASTTTNTPQPMKHTQPLVTLQPSTDLSATAPTRPIRTLGGGGGGVVDEGATVNSKRVLFQEKSPSITPIYSASPILATTSTTTTSALKQPQMTYPSPTSTTTTTRQGGSLTSKPRKGTGVVINIGAMRRN